MASSNVAAVTPVLEPDVAAQVVAVGDVVEVALDLGLRGEVLGPHPLLLELGVEAERVLEARDVAARAGIAVPEPGAADAGALLEHHDAQALLAKDLQRVEAGHAGADDDDVDIEPARVVDHALDLTTGDTSQLGATMIGRMWVDSRDRRIRWGGL